MNNIKLESNKEPDERKDNTMFLFEGFCLLCMILLLLVVSAQVIGKAFDQEAGIYKANQHQSRGK